MGAALIAAAVAGVGVVGARVYSNATPQGDRCRIPELRDRSAREEPDGATRLHRVRHRWLRHLSALAARIRL